jgi:hypothetical protein
MVLRQPHRSCSRLKVIRSPRPSWKAVRVGIVLRSLPQSDVHFLDLLDHPKVADAGVVGIQDDYAGELPIAFIVLKPDVSSALSANPQLASGLRKSIFEVMLKDRLFYAFV